MDTRIELNSSHYNGEGGWQNADGVIYKINEDGTTATARGTSNEITSMDIVIANEVAIDGNVYPVTHVEGFYTLEAITSLYLPTNIKVIGRQVFQNCNIESLYIQGTSIEKIWVYAFFNATIKNVKLNGFRGGAFINSSKTIENLYCDSLETLFSINDKTAAKNIYIDGVLVEELVIPEGVTEIPESFVKGCESLKTVVLPSTIKTINDCAFNACENLSSINLPEGLEKIGFGAFGKCRSLNKIDLPNSISLIARFAFDKTNVEHIVIPEGVQLGDNVFSECVNLKSVQLPEGLTIIPAYAFSECLSLTRINIPSTVKKIGDKALSNCDIAELHLPEQLEYIGEDAFSFLPITEITIPASVVEIGEWAFEGCDKLSKVYSKIEDPGKCDVKTLERPSKKRCEIKCGYITSKGEPFKYTLGTEVFYKQATLVVPNIKGIVNAYKKKAAWKKFSAIEVESE